MSLSINTNIASLQAQNNLSQVNKALEQNQERLSSGLRINSAADDAAGMAISDRMTAQIKGMNQASRNASNGISMIQTAEGGSQEITNLLQRMREISVQSANESNTSQDRTSLNDEFTQLKEEVNRIAESTSFNGQDLLDGSRGTADFQVGPDTGGQNSIQVDMSNSMKANKIGDVNVSGDISVSSFSNNGPISFGAGTTKISTSEINGSGAEDIAQAINSTNQDIKTSGGTTTDVVAEASGSTIDLTASEEIEYTIGSGGAGISGTVDSSGNLNNADISTQNGARDAIIRIDSAINDVDQFRATMGAAQNRMESTISNLENATQNLTESRSRIQDADIAKQAAEQTQNNVRRQAASSVLTQANQSPQLALQLLGG